MNPQIERTNVQIPESITYAANTLYQISGLSVSILKKHNLLESIGEQNPYQYLNTIGQEQFLAEAYQETLTESHDSAPQATILGFGNLASVVYIPLSDNYGFLLGPYRVEALKCPMNNSYFQKLSEEDRQSFLQLCSNFPLKSELSISALIQTALTLNRSSQQKFSKKNRSSTTEETEKLEIKSHDRMIKQIFSYVQEEENPNVALMVRDMVCNGNAERAAEIYQKSISHIAKPIHYTTCPKKDELYHRIGLMHSIFYKMVECSVDHANLITIKNKYLGLYNRTNCTQEMDLITLDMFNSFASHAKLNMQIESYTELIQKAIVYIYDHSKLKISLKDVAAALHVNACYLSSIFKKETGKSLTIFITEIKIEEAKRLLQNTSFPITTICYEIGFDNPSYFTEVFKKITGITPKEFKVQSRSES